MTRPTLETLVRRASGGLAGRLSRSFPFRSPEVGVTYAYAGAIHGINGYAESVSRRALPDTADAEALAAWAAGRGLSRDPGELLEVFRARVLATARGPSDTGLLDDYVRWALEAPTEHGPCYRAWARPSPTYAGQIDVWAMIAPPDSEDTPAELIEDLQAYIDAMEIIGDIPVVQAPTFQTVNVSVKVTATGAASPSADTIARVRAAVRSLFWSIAEPGDGAGAGAFYRWQVARALLPLGYPTATVTLPVAEQTTPAYGAILVPGSIGVS